MKWINSYDGRLINVNFIKEFIMYNIYYKDKFLGIEIRISGNDFNENVIGYSENWEKLCDFFEVAVHKIIVKFEDDFTDICEKNYPDAIQLHKDFMDSQISMDKFNNDYFIFNEKREKLIKEIYKERKYEEIQIDFYF